MKESREDLFIDDYEHDKDHGDLIPDMLEPSVQLNLTEDIDKAIHMVNYLAMTIGEVINSAELIMKRKISKAERVKAFYKKLGINSPAEVRLYKERLSEMVSDLRFLLYGYREDNPYKKEWDKYKKAKNGDFGSLM